MSEVHRHKSERGRKLDQGVLGGDTGFTRAAAAKLEEVGEDGYELVPAELRTARHAAAPPAERLFPFAPEHYDIEEASYREAKEGDEG